MQPRDLQQLCERFLEAAGTAQRRRQRTALERRMQRQISTAFKQQGKLVVGLLARYRGRFAESLSGDDLTAFLAAASKTTATVMQQPLSLAWQQALGSGMSKAVSDLKAGVAFDLKNPRAVAWLKAHAATAISQIDDTTQAALRELLAQATDEGWSYDQTAAAITAMFDGFAGAAKGGRFRNRAQLIAVTEIGNAYVAGNLIVAQDLQAAGLEMEKSWLTTGDAKVSNGCRANAAVGWIPLDQAFPSGDQAPCRFPGDRCDILIRRKPTKEER